MGKNKDKKAFNGDFGLTVRHCICEKYNVPQSEGTKKYFKKTVNAKYKKDIDEQLDEIFGKIKRYPFEYIQQRRQEKNFYNFKLRTSPRGRKIETISIRTNKKGASVAPRITGQLMLDPFNSFFCDIVGRKADRRSDVKAIIYENIDAMIQYFVQYMFTSDYNCWLYYEDGSLHKDLKKWKDVQNFELPEGTLKFGKKNRNGWTEKQLTDWENNAQLYYFEKGSGNNKGLCLATVQVFEDDPKHCLIFRFHMKELLSFIEKEKRNTEKFGMSAEFAICKKFQLGCPDDLESRSDLQFVQNFSGVLEEAFKKIPLPQKHTGHIRKGKEKCPYDFELENGKTLSLKTNRKSNSLVCPPQIGQPSAETCLNEFRDILGSNVKVMDAEIFKNMVCDNLVLLLQRYLNKLLEADYLLWIKEGKKESPYYGMIIPHMIDPVCWDEKKLEMTQSRDQWLVSNTIKYWGTTIGNFEVHLTRTSFKFRFDIERLVEFFEPEFKEKIICLN